MTAAILDFNTARLSRLMDDVERAAEQHPDSEYARLKIAALEAKKRAAYARIDASNARMGIELYARSLAEQAPCDVAYPEGM